MTYREFAHLRRLSGLTQVQAALELGVSDRTVMRWEHGDTRIGELQAQAIRLRLATRLFGKEEDPAKASY